ncbi:MAG TPA: DNA polymerase III subunit delta' [Flavobacteriaceae bacterium]|nr:DNA polymerase III subunit delta' [Flavobacteriaceae bacterium]
MLFSEIVGLNHIKTHLAKSADEGRLPHAQLFVGSHGSGTLPMAIAYAQYVLCRNSSGENSIDNSCNHMCNKLAHPDLHFAFPVAANEKIKKHPVSNQFLEEWRNFLLSNPYGSLFDWYQLLGIENKQGQIGVDESEEIVKALSLKAYEGGLKIMIIWHAEKMNAAAANKLLKLIEEPPPKTIFLLIAEEEGSLLQTIRSRCQMLHFPPLSEEVIMGALRKSVSTEKAALVARQSNGNYARALQLLERTEGEEVFEMWFIKWVRIAFQAKSNLGSIQGLLSWSVEIAKTGRETQKKFLLYCLDFFRQALLLNYQADELVYFSPTKENFKLEKFAPFVHGNNIVPIYNEIQNALFHIERNGNAKIVLTDLSIKLMRLLHTKP